MSVVVALAILVVLAFVTGLVIGAKVANRQADRIISGQRSQIADLIEQIDNLSHRGTNGRNGR